jgi:hypothetical protein
MTLSVADEINEARAILSATWAALPDALRRPTQFLGRHYAGCGAIIGVMPRCDFTCTACYLSEGSNRTSPLPIGEVKAQILALRRWLGPAGNLQLTDGEITLLSESELVGLIAYARAVGLVPMLMTHGETFRRKPGLLERLMTEGGLTEVCFHVDTTMRGRRDHYANAVTEEDLNSLREEFANIIRMARRRTGLRLEAASTVTVTASNMEGVPGIVRWFLVNADAFKMLSFQPVADVGRTAPGLDSVSPDRLWARIAEGAGNPHILRGEGWLGHPACGRFVQGLAVHRREGVALEPLYRFDSIVEMIFLRRLLDRIGGISFRLDTPSQTIRRIMYMLRRNSGFFLKHGLPYLWRLLNRVGTLRAHYFCIVSHHFMNSLEIASPLGGERRSACVFRVPINGRLEPMCAVNATGMRARFYDSTERIAFTGGAE